MVVLDSLVDYLAPTNEAPKQVSYIKEFILNIAILDIITLQLVIQHLIQPPIRLVHINPSHIRQTTHHIVYLFDEFKLS